MAFKLFDITHSELEYRIKKGGEYTQDCADRRRYFDQYESLIAFAKEIKPEDSISIDILALSIYAWMPTILKNLETGSLLKVNGFSIQDIRKVQSDGAQRFLEAYKVEYSKTGAPINNSWVGTSKFLHFLNPSVFPIWDSKICRAIAGPSNPNKFKHYRAYVELIHETISKSNSAMARLRSSLKLDEDKITDVRLIEMCLFAYGDETQHKNR